MTLATYQILTYRPDKKEEFPHFKLFDQRDWGLIIYDEVHLLPAPVFRVTAQIQARRRLGPDRDAGPRGRPRGRRLQPDRPEEVRRALARAGDAAAGSPRRTAPRSASPCPTPLRMEYAVAEWRNKYRIASENPAKDDVVGRAARPLPRTAAC